MRKGLLYSEYQALSAALEYRGWAIRRVATARKLVPRGFFEEREDDLLGRRLHITQRGEEVLRASTPPKSHAKKKRKGSVGDHQVITIRMPVQLVAEVGAWAASQGGLERSAALRKLIKAGLAGAAEE